MCNYIDCEHSRGSASIGVTAEGFLATFAILGVATVIGAILKAALVPIGVALVLGWLLYWRPTRRATLTACSVLTAGGLWLVRFAWRRLWRRRPGKTVALPQAYRADLWIETRDGRHLPLLSGPVPGTWTSAAQVKEEIVQRWIAQNGRPATGRLVCVAEPVGGAQ